MSWRNLLPIACLALAVWLCVPQAPLATAGAASPPGDTGFGVQLATASVVRPLTLGTDSGNLVSHGEVGSLPSNFWGVVGHTNGSSGIIGDPSVGTFLNSTPIDTIRYGEMDEQCDVRNDSLWSPGGVHGWISGKCPYSIQDFKTWCYSLTTHCSSVITLPGEIDSVSQDLYEAEYIVNTVGFQPTYWAIGNEPDDNASYRFWGEPWADWTLSDENSTNSATPSEYATLVANVISGFSSAETNGYLPSGQKFIGIEAATDGAGSGSHWIKAVALQDGASISAIAYHTYPTANGTQSYPGNPSTYYEPLGNAYNVTNSYYTVRHAISGLCTGCSTLPIQIGEFNGGPSAGSSGATKFDSQYPGAVFLGASIAQALDVGVSSFQTFDLQGANVSRDVPGFGMIFNGTNSNALDPQGVLLSQLMPYTFEDGETNEVYNVSISTAASNVFAAYTRYTSLDKGVQSLLVVNANLDDYVNVSLNGVLETGCSTTGYHCGVMNITWDNGTPTITIHVLKWEGYYVVAPQSILVLQGGWCTGTGCAGDSPDQGVSATFASQTEPSNTHLPNEMRPPQPLWGLALPMIGGFLFTPLLGMASAARFRASRQLGLDRAKVKIH